jgi:hypothetical protein
METCEFYPCNRPSVRKLGGRSYCRSHVMSVRRLRQCAVAGVFGRPRAETICMLLKWREK